MIDRPSSQYRALSVAWNVPRTTVFDAISPIEHLQRLAVEVTQSGAGNVVCIRSDECVHNKTQVPIRVLLVNAAEKDETLTETVEPGTNPNT